MDSPKLRVLFLGTPEFATGILKELLENNFNIVAVVTNIDKPAGRGQIIHQSSVKKFADEKNLMILQPDKLKNEEFLNELKKLNIDIAVVVAFRMMPEALWSLPRLGTINLHASLLPQYRGAAPINWAIINGEKETGVTTFFLQQEIDTGKIIFRETIQITDKDSAGSLHDKLMCIGSKLVVITLKAIESGTYPQIEQTSLVSENKTLNIAPKIFKADCRIRWNNKSENIFNLIRGLSPYPTAWTKFKSPNKNPLLLKIFEASTFDGASICSPGHILSDNKTYLHINTGNGLISIEDLQLEGKKRLKIKEFLAGFPNIINYNVE